MELIQLLRSIAFIEIFLYLYKLISHKTKTAIIQTEGLYLIKNYPEELRAAIKYYYRTHSWEKLYKKHLSE